jgi:glycosyltransferase involved in cell wall biosynthesis
MSFSGCEAYAPPRTGGKRPLVDSTCPSAEVSAALNRAAAEATGDALAFIDADDLWTTGKLDRQIEALAADPVAKMRSIKANTL